MKFYKGSKVRKLVLYAVSKHKKGIESHAVPGHGIAYAAQSCHCSYSTIAFYLFPAS